MARFFHFTKPGGGQAARFVIRPAERYWKLVLIPEPGPQRSIELADAIYWLDGELPGGFGVKPLPPQVEHHYAKGGSVDDTQTFRDYVQQLAPSEFRALIDKRHNRRQQ